MLTRVTTYAELYRWTRAFMSGSFELLFLVGPPGLAKSHGIQQWVAKEAAKKSKTKTKTQAKTLEASLPANHKDYPLYLEGTNVTAFKLYQSLYEHMHQLVILDDTDAIYTNRDLIRLLKALCQSRRPKTIGWHTANTRLEEAGIPNAFDTNSRVCIIANRWDSLSHHVESLESRGVMIQFEPSAPEVLKYIKANKIVTDKMVLKFIQDYIWLLPTIDIRAAQHAQIAKKARLPWQDALARSCHIYEMILIQQLKYDKNFPTQALQEMAWMKMTNLSRPMYYKFKERLVEAAKMNHPITKRKKK